MCIFPDMFVGTDVSLCYLIVSSFFAIHVKQARVHLLNREPFEDAFGPKTKRKRPKLLAADYESLVKKAGGSQGKSPLFLKFPSVLD